MGRCVVHDCHARKGTHRFPHRDPVRFRKWVNLLSSHQGKPFTVKPSSRICTLHFEAKHVRRCVDLPDRLTKDAVPNLIQSNLLTKSRQETHGKKLAVDLKNDFVLEKTTGRRKLEDTSKATWKLLGDDHNYMIRPTVDDDADTTTVVKAEVSLKVPEESKKNKEETSSSSVAKKQDDTEEVKHLRNQCSDLHKKVNYWRSRCHSLKETLDTENSCLSRLFSSDQIDWLRNKSDKSKRMSFSPQTMAKGFHLRLNIGDDAYKHLVSTGFPYPSFERMQRYIKRVVKQPGELHNVDDPSNDLPPWLACLSKPARRKIMFPSPLDASTQILDLEEMDK